MGKTNGEVISTFKIHREKLNSIVRRYGKEWGLEKSPTGQYSWSDENLTKLKNYLSEHGQNLDPGLSVTTRDLVTNKELAMTIATAIGERLNVMESRLEARFQKERESYSQEISGLKRELTVIKNSLPPTHGDRRHEPVTFWEVCYRDCC